MSKFYKLIKEYPGSPTKGTIVYKGLNSLYHIIASHYYNKERVMTNVIDTLIAFKTEEIENYPEFWKPAYQIADGYAVDDETVYVLTLSPDHPVEGNTVVSLIYKYSRDNIFLNKENLDKRIKELRQEELRKRDLNYIAISKPAPFINNKN